MCKTPFGSQRGGVKIPHRPLEFGNLSYLASCVKSMTNYLNCPSAMTIPPE